MKTEQDQRKQCFRKVKHVLWDGQSQTNPAVKILFPLALPVMLDTVLPHTNENILISSVSCIENVGIKTKTFIH